MILNHNYNLKPKETSRKTSLYAQEKSITMVKDLKEESSVGLELCSHHHEFEHDICCQKKRKK